MKGRKLGKKISLTTLILALSVPFLSGCDENGNFDFNAILSWLEDVGNAHNSAISEIGSGAGDLIDDASSGYNSAISDIGHGAGEWIDETGRHITAFVDGPLASFLNDVQEGAHKVNDDVTKFLVDSYQTISTSVCDIYERVKDGVITFYNGIVDNLTVKEAIRSTADYALNADDNETLMYAIIDTQLSDDYDVFPAYVYHPRTHEVIDGIGFTDNSEQYVSEDGVGYYASGFISGYNEAPLSEEDIQNGIEIIRPDDNSDLRYVYCYEVKPFQSHFVANDRYVLFGIDENHSLRFEERSKGTYESQDDYGGLYDYDNKTWLVGNSNDFISVDGNLMASQSLGAGDVVQALFTQTNQGGYSFTVDNVLNGASNAIYSVQTTLRDAKASSFLGNNIEDLSEALNNIQGSDVIDTSKEAFTLHSVPETIGDVNVTKLAKVLAIVSTVLSFAGILVCRCLEKVNPVFAVLKGAFAAIQGCAIDLLVQTLLEKKSINEVNWGRLIFSSLSSVLIVYTSSIMGRALTKSISKSAIAFGFQNKATLDTMQVFGETFIATLMFGGLSQVAIAAKNGITGGVKSLVSKKGQSTVKVAGKQLAKASSEFASAMSQALAGQAELELDDDEAPEEEKAMWAYYEKTIRQMPSDDNKNLMKVDGFGNAVYKDDGSVRENIVNGKEVYVRARPGHSQEISAILAQEGLESEESFAYFNGRFMVFAKPIGAVDIGSGYVGETARSAVLTKADETLAAAWKEEPSSMPSVAASYLEEKGLESTQLTAEVVASFRQEKSLTWHEVSDQSLQLVNQNLHRLLSFSGGATFSRILIASNNGQSLLGSASV